MLTFRTIDNIGNEAVEIMDVYQQEILLAMVDALSEALSEDAGRATDYEIRSLLETTILAILARALKNGEQDIQSLTYGAARAAVGASVLNEPWMDQVLRAGMKKTYNTYRNLTGTTGHTAMSQFDRALSRAHNRIAYGGMSYQQAITEAITNLARSGVEAIRYRAVLYESGRSEHLDSATRRAVLTGVNQTAAQVQLENVRRLGTDLVETSAHPGARSNGLQDHADHAYWQGKIYSISGSSPTYPKLSDATGFPSDPLGLCGYNCRHTFYGYNIGLSDRTYSADTLDRYANETVEYNGDELTIYEATQKQRELERGVRAAKRKEIMLKSAGLDTRRARQSLRHYQSRLRDFTRQTGLARDYFRERVIEPQG